MTLTYNKLRVYQLITLYQSLFISGQRNAEDVLARRSRRLVSASY